MRADKLKEEGQFFDARQLAEWITKLQPRFSAVWEFQAWNMAYNISVAIPATQPEQRRRWVKNGYELLRDQGIPLNPKSIPLYRELSRILQHKLGGVSDDAQEYYKLQFANEIGPLLESPDNGISRRRQQVLRSPDSNRWRMVPDRRRSQCGGIPPGVAHGGCDFHLEDDFVKNYLTLRRRIRAGRG